MEFSEDEIDTAVYGAHDPENGAAYYRDAVAKADSSDGAEAAEYVLDKIRTAKRPVFMIGHGSFRRQQKKCSQIWHSSPSHSDDHKRTGPKSVLRFDDPLNFGCIGGAYGHRYANMIANAKSDLLLCFGISLCTRQIGTKVHEFAKRCRRSSVWILILIIFRERSMRE